LKRLERLEYGRPQNERFENSFSPDGKKAASIQLPIPYSPGGEYNFVTIYDLQEEVPIATFDAGVGYNDPKFVWSKDSSKLLISFNSPYGRVVVYDLSGPSHQEERAPYPTVGKLVGEYRIKASKEKIDSLSFGEDGRSVSIKLTDGQTEVWQLP
jgi:WD40 repeat protein